jgi:hypothetical protein
MLKSMIGAPAMTKHTPAALALVLGLAGATGLMAQAPTHDVDAVTETPVVQVADTPSAPSDASMLRAPK